MLLWWRSVAVYSYRPEVFPTWIHASGTGLSSALGRVGSILAPTINGLSSASLGFAGVFGLRRPSWRRTCSSSACPPQAGPWRN